MGISEEIRSQSSMQRIFDYYGIKEVRNGQYICPFHNDHKPSMSIKDDKYFKCWTCGEKGSVLDFIKNYEENVLGHSMNWRDVYEKAIEIQNLNITLDEKQEENPEQKHRRRLYEIMKKSVEISKKNLEQKHVLVESCNNYLRQRKISPETAKRFNLGFEFGNSFVRELIKNEGYTLSELIEVNLIRTSEQGKNYEVFGNRLLVPISDEYGRPVGFGGRVLPSQANDRTPKYLNTSATPLFNKSKILFNFNNASREAVKRNNIVILEGYFDVISAHEMGMPNAVALMGVALSDYQINMLKSLNCEVTLSLDNDKAGRDTMLKLIPVLYENDINAYVYDTSKLNGNLKDFGDFLTSGKQLEEITDTRISAFDFMMKHKYFEGKTVNADSVYSVYKQSHKDGFLNNSQKKLMYRDFVLNNSDISKEEYEQVIHPVKLQEENTIKNDKVENFKSLIFNTCIKSLIKNYAESKGDKALMNYCKESYDENTIVKGLSKYLSDDGSIQTDKFITEYIMKLPEYKSQNKVDLDKFEVFLSNAYCIDKYKTKQKIYLNEEQKKKVVEQLKKTTPKDMKKMFSEKPDLFSKLVIADSLDEYDSLFLKTNSQKEKRDALRFFKKGNIAFINYGQAFSPDDIPRLIKEDSEYVSSERKEFNKVVVFNNMNKEIKITPENYALLGKEIEKNSDKEKSSEKSISQKEDEMTIIK